MKMMNDFVATGKRHLLHLKGSRGNLISSLNRFLQKTWLHNVHVNILITKQKTAIDLCEDLFRLCDFLLRNIFTTFFK